jgi:uncharacterized protein (DUF697 family)
MQKAVDQTGSFMNVRTFVSVLREISFDDVRADAETIPRLLVLAPTVTEARDLGLRLIGANGDLAIAARELNSPPPDLERFDAIIVHDPARTGVAHALRDRQTENGGSATVHVFDDRLTATDMALESLRAAIVRAVPDRAPAFGRAFSVFRPAASRAVINETSTANGQFALVSNIPALIPIFGGLASATADFIVLTKNQVMMIYKLGAIYGRDLSDQFKIIQELAPVVGAGFIWRSLARSAVTMLPFAAGTVPKVGIAYAGTMAVGLAADYYYRTDLRPSRAQLRAFQRQAVDVIRRIPLPVLQDRIKQRDTGIGDEALATSSDTGPASVLYLPTPDQRQARSEPDDPMKSATE